MSLPPMIIKISFGLFCVFLTFISFFAPAYSECELAGPYLGQQASSTKAKIFAPDIVSTKDSEILSGFRDRGRLLVFERIKTRPSKEKTVDLYIMHERKGCWQPPSKSKYPLQDWYKNFSDIKEGEEFLFGKVKDVPGSPYVINIVSATKLKTGWSQPKDLTINSDRIDTWPSQAEDGNVYFFSNRIGGSGGHDLYVAHNKEGVFRKPVNIKILNSEFSETDPQIAADSRYLIFSSNREGGFGDYDLYISFHKAGKWTKPKNLGTGINSVMAEERPYLTADGKYLFFSHVVKGVLNILWIDTVYFNQFNP